MTAESFFITEITGSQRSIELKNRALPYRPIEWPGSQHNKQTWYAGNRVATIQVLGPRENSIEIKGVWKTRYLRSDAVLIGFDDLVSAGENITAEILTKAFHVLRRSGNQIEIRWGPEVRRGIIESFIPNYQRIEDIEWSIMFVCSQYGDAPAPIATEKVSSPTKLMNASLIFLNDIFALIPVFLLPNVTRPITLTVTNIRTGVINLNRSLAFIFGGPAVSYSARRNIETLVKKIIDDTNTLIGICANGPYLPFIPTDPVNKVLAAEVWRRKMTKASIGVQIASITARRNVRDRTVPGFIGSETIRQNMTLRSLARKYYGDSDSWSVIADANNFVGSRVPIGTVVLIPRPAQSGAGIRAK